MYVVFPTGVGVYRVRRAHSIIKTRFPHRRGGVPYPNRPKARLRAFSPQAWGCTAKRAVAVTGHAVFPTGVGVYRLALPYRAVR